MQLIAIVLEVLLGLAFLAAGGQKLAGSAGQKELFKHLRYPGWFMYAAGAVEVAGAVGMILGLLFSPAWAALAGLLLMAQMIGALASHARVKDPVQKMVPAAALLMLAVAVTVLQFPSL